MRAVVSDEPGFLNFKEDCLILFFMIAKLLLGLLNNAEILELIVLSSK